MKKTILIGGARAQKLPSLVCEYSIRRRTKAPLEIFHGYDDATIDALRPENHTRTGFSFQRFTLPARAKYAGLGVYLDSDMILRDDIAKLFALAEHNVLPMCTPNLPAVIALDCELLRWDVHELLTRLDVGEFTYQQLMDLDIFRMSRTIPATWNCLDAAPAGAQLVHYTDMSRQCWRVPDDRPVSALWRRELYDAVADGAIARELVKEEISLGHVRLGGAP